MVFQFLIIVPILFVWSVLDDLFLRSRASVNHTFKVRLAMLYIEEVLRYHRYQESVPLEASAVAFFSELCFNILLSAYLHFTVKFDCVCGTNPLKGGAVQQCMGFRAVSCIFCACMLPSSGRCTFVGSEAGHFLWAPCMRASTRCSAISFCLQCNGLKN